MRKKLCFILTRGPYGSGIGSDALDAILAASVFDQKVSVIFMEDGIFQLLQNESAEGIGLKGYRKGFAALSDYGINRIIVDKCSAEERGISKQDLLLDTEWLTNQDISNVIRKSDHIFSF